MQPQIAAKPALLRHSAGFKYTFRTNLTAGRISLAAMRAGGHLNQFQKFSWRYCAAGFSMGNQNLNQVQYGEMYGIEKIEAPLYPTAISMLPSAIKADWQHCQQGKHLNGNPGCPNRDDEGIHAIADDCHCGKLRQPLRLLPSNPCISGSTESYPNGPSS